MSLIIHQNSTPTHENDTESIENDTNSLNDQQQQQITNKLSLIKNLSDPNQQQQQMKTNFANKNHNNNNNDYCDDIMTNPISDQQCSNDNNNNNIDFNDKNSNYKNNYTYLQNIILDMSNKNMIFNGQQSKHLLNHHISPAYVNLTQTDDDDNIIDKNNNDDDDDDDVEAKNLTINGDDDDQNIDDDDDDDLASKSSSYLKNIEPINSNKIKIVRTRSKQSKFRISYILLLFKSCFCRGPMMMRIFSALFFAISSFLLVVINKIILTTYHFPSVMIVGLGQVFATIIVLNILRHLKVVKFPYYSHEVNAKISPLPIFFFGNLVAGLGSTKRLNLPMLTVLRRFTILMTMIGEYYILGVKQSTTIKMTVFMMIGGAIIAASNDLAFDMMGYFFVLLNDVFSTFNGIYMKKKLDSRDLGKYGILYYNALFISIPLLLLSFCVDDWHLCFIQFEHWQSPLFVLSFLMSSIMGFILMYSTALCTQYNSALTTTIVGCLKNILVTFIGMYIGGDYIFSIVNFIGLNISMIGSLIYSYVIFVHKSHHTSNSSSSSSTTSTTLATTATLSSSQDKQMNSKSMNNQKSNDK